MHKKWSAQAARRGCCVRMHCSRTSRPRGGICSIAPATIARSSTRCSPTHPRAWPPAHGTRRLQALWRRHAQIVQTDHFPGDAMSESQAALEALQAAWLRVSNPEEPHATATAITRLDPARYVARVWATRRRPWVDRLASAWLLRRPHRSAGQLSLAGEDERLRARLARLRFRRCRLHARRGPRDVRNHCSQASASKTPARSLASASLFTSSTWGVRLCRRLPASKRPSRVFATTSRTMTNCSKRPVPSSTACTAASKQATPPRRYPVHDHSSPAPSARPSGRRFASG